MLSLKETQNRCLPDLNSSCQAIAIAEVLKSLISTTNSTGKKPTNELNPSVVRYRVRKGFSFGSGSGFKYHCYRGGGGRAKEDERHPVYCGFDVKESIWMSVFNTVLNVVVSIVFLYRPYLFCVVPDFFTDEHRQERKRKLFSKQENNDYGKEGTNSDEIPLDDVSPITCAEMVWKCVKKLPSF